MRIQDALNILKPKSTDLDAIKSAWRKACSKYHPDKGGSTAMMQAVNEAYETLLNAEHIDQPESFTDYGDELNAAINAILDLPGLDIEVCGSWVWVGGDTRTHKDALKAAGYKWASKKKMWNFRPAGFRSFSRGDTTMDDIRTKYGSSRPGFTPGNRISVRA
jgi:curved DNA-binding protein CbpA